jgi:hypothetical protein
MTTKKDSPIIIDFISPEILRKLAAKEHNAFVPISAAELIWLESLPSETTNDAKDSG